MRVSLKVFKDKHNKLWFVNRITPMRVGGEDCVLIELYDQGGYTDWVMANTASVSKLVYPIETWLVKELRLISV
jgi:hypothetical protein